MRGSKSKLMRSSKLRHCLPILISLLLCSCSRVLYTGPPSDSGPIPPTRAERVETPTKYSIDITSSPQGALIVINKKKLGRTPIHADILGGINIWTRALYGFLDIEAYPTEETAEKKQYIRYVSIRYQEKLPRKIHFNLYSDTEPPVMEY